MATSWAVFLLAVLRVTFPAPSHSRHGHREFLYSVVSEREICAEKLTIEERVVGAMNFLVAFSKVNMVLMPQVHMLC